MLGRYRQALPRDEFAAFKAWLDCFYLFQREWLLEPARAAICNKARQIGLSHTTGALGVIWGAMHGELTTIISVGQEESNEVLDKARKHAQVLQRLGSRMAMPGRKDNEHTLTFASGGRILAMPSSGGRSFSGNVFLDEFAYQQHAGKVMDAAAAVTMLDGRLRILSTPNGVGNDFEQLWTKVKKGELKGWAKHELSLQRAIDEGYPVDLVHCRDVIAKGDPRLFDQLFCCSFIDSNFQYIPSELFAGCFADWPSLPGGQLYAGLDIGETRDRTVLVIIRRRGNRRQLVHIETHGKTNDELLDSLVKKAIKDYKATLVCADATGIGRFPAQRMAETWGRRFEGVNFTVNSKEDLATGLYDAVARKELELPNSYPWQGIDEMQPLREDVYAIRREVTSSGNVRFVAARSEKGHADRAWALMLALHAAGSMSPMFAALQS